MNRSFINPHFLILSFLFLAFTALRSQTAEQARSFITRSQMAISKAQKELLKQSDHNHDADLRKAAKLQVIAVKLYKQNNFKDAVGFSFRSRSQSLGILNDICKEAVSGLSLNADEKSFCDAASYNNLEPKKGQLTQAESDKIDNMNTFDPRQLMELEIGIKSN